MKQNQLVLPRFFVWCLLPGLGCFLIFNLQAQTVTVNPAALTLGYMNWSPMPGDASGFGGSGGGTWGLADLRANFSGTTLTLRPNTNAYAPGNNYWINADGTGANRMDANIYNETTGTYVGTTLTFNYMVTANTLSSRYSSQAFIKDFAADYSSSTQVTAPLTVGAGSISLLTSTNAAHHIQYGFETFGPDANPAMAAALGSVIVTPATDASVAGTSSLLSNPGFESDPAGENQNLAGWSIYGPNVDNETSATLAHGGANYFKVYQDLTSGSVNYSGIYQDYISGPGATYSADGWAYALSTDKLAGQNTAWIEVTFRDADAEVLALYRSALITTNSLGNGSFPMNTWVDLPVTNQYNLGNYQVTNTAARLVAPSGTYFVRYQIVFQGDGNGSGGNMFFDDLNLSPAGDPAYGNWNIVWSDEFNGTNIDLAVWTYDIGNGGSNPGWGNNEQEYYTSRTNNAYVAGGLLHIVAQQDSTYANGYNYTSARLKTQGLRSWRYGRFEWRARLPVGTGFWPALWFLGTNFPATCWPECGEIDVMENASGNPTVGGTIHANNICGVDQYETAGYNFLNGDSVTRFHTYNLDWSTNSLSWYVDGHLYETQTTNWVATAPGYPAPFNQPFFMIMNLAVGGNYVGNQTPAANAFPAEMQIDYVRMYRQTAPLLVSVTPMNNSWVLTWPGNIVSHLQTQIVGPGGGLGTNWMDTTNFGSAVISPTNTAEFFRVASP